MAKARKQKSEEQQKAADDSETVVHNQKICLSIDMDNRLIHGFTELDVIVPDNGILGLHVDNLKINSVTVDGEAALFDFFPHYMPVVGSEDRWSSVSSPTSAADAAGSVYLSIIEKELVPNLLIMCALPPKTPPVDDARKDAVVVSEEKNDAVQTSGKTNQNMKKVRIDYCVERTDTGIHFTNGVLHTDNQIRRARCWFPCIDNDSHCCCYDLEFTVGSSFVAASTGCLLYQVLSENDPPCTTYVYRVDVPVAARWISLVVAQFEILPDHHRGILTHMCLPDNLSKLRNAVGFFHGAFSYYEDYLSISFPFGSYTQIFIAPDMAISSSTFGASMSIFSSQVLFDEKVIDQIIETRIKLAHALANQWFGVYITAASPNDEWLLDGLAGFLTDSFIKQFLGNNEARYRRYKANCAVCKADGSAATALSCSSSCKDLYGTQRIGFFGKIRSWKSVAVLQMLEKQMGPEPFRKILQRIVSRARDTSHNFRILSSKEFRQLANKVGNLERPFLKEFFLRWVESCGCPVMKMGFSYNKRKNMIELAVMRGLTAIQDPSGSVPNGNLDPENREGGWPGMMSIRVHELDGMYDHPILPMAGETWQLLEIQCHSKLASKRFQKTKKGSKLDGSDDNADAVPSIDMHSNNDSPLLWVRADPEMEYLAEIHFNQPLQMWINQLEKDRDVVAQALAIKALEMLPQISFTVVNTLYGILSDSKAFWRIRIEAAFALANMASEETDWAGMLHLVKFYKSRRFDSNLGLPKPNDFRDFPEYFVLKAIPHAIAMVRTADNKSPREAVEFILHLLKYNDNNGNQFSDVFWLAALVQAIGELEFGQQNINFLSSLLKRIDRLLQFDRLMPSYNGLLTISCIGTLIQIALKLSGLIPFMQDRVLKLIKPFCSPKTIWQVRIEAARAFLDLEFHCNGINAALMLFISYLREESSLRGQVKLGIHAVRLCQLRGGSDGDNTIKSETLVALLRLLESPIAFNNVNLRHYLFCIFQVLGGRMPTLSGVPRDETLLMGHEEFCTNLKNLFANIVRQPKCPISSLDIMNLPFGASIVPEPCIEVNTISTINEQSNPPVQSLDIFNLPNAFVVPEAFREADSISNDHGLKTSVLDVPGDGLFVPEALAEEDNVRHEQVQPVVNLPEDSSVFPEAGKEIEIISNSHERKKPVVKIRVKQSAASSRAEDADTATAEKSLDGRYDADIGASSSISVDAPQRNFTETISASNQNLEDVTSCHDVGSRVTASIGSAKLASDGDELMKELQCTADSSKVSILPQPADGLLPSGDLGTNVETGSHKFASEEAMSGIRNSLDFGLLEDNPRVRSKEKDKKQSKEKKRKRHDHKGSHDDPEYSERKRLKKEKKRAKEMAKLQSGKSTPSIVDLQDKREKAKVRLYSVSQDSNGDVVVDTCSKNDDFELRLAVEGGVQKPSPLELHSRKLDVATKMATVQIKLGEPGGSKDVEKDIDTSVKGPEVGTSRKIKIKLKTRTGNQP